MLGYVPGSPVLHVLPEPEPGMGARLALLQPLERVEAEAVAR
jgi:hypothetical protein